MYYRIYQSPLGELLLTSDGPSLTGLWFVRSRFYSDNLKCGKEELTPSIEQTVMWLNEYFKGQEPNFLPPLRLDGTKFQMDVWEILSTIPYGQTVTYGSIAKKIAAKYGMARIAAQAVGQAVGHNPISIIVPCHRVVGANGQLTGYGAGLDKKIFLLNLEGIDIPSER